LPKYRIEYSPETEDHFQYLSKRQQVLVLNAIEKQLQFQPNIETRNRKPMRPNPLAPWELRIGALRIYYDFEDTPERIVLVRAIGIKERNNVRIGKEVIKV
jgi:mRNA-degrading endonuclease RelE of RelBE toxin-antitoxin system